MVRTDIPVLLYKENEYTGEKTYAIAVFEDIISYENYPRRRRVFVLNERNVLSEWIEHWDESFGHWGKFYSGEFCDHVELIDAAWETNGSGII